MSNQFIKGFLLACVIWSVVIFNTRSTPYNTITIDTPEGVAKISGEGRYYLMDNFIERD